MKKCALVLPLLCVLPLSAQSFEAGLFVGQQSFKAISNGTLVASESSKTTVGARVGYALVDMGPALLQVTAGYQPKVTTTMTSNQFGTQNFSASHYSVGLMANFKAVLAVGAGVEYRSETLSTDALSTTYGRPWARVNAGMAFPTPFVKPFVGLEVAMPLTSKTLDASFTNTDLLQAAAPKLEVGLYGGIRF